MKPQASLWRELSRAGLLAESAVQNCYWGTEGGQNLQLESSQALRIACEVLSGLK